MYAEERQQAIAELVMSRGRASVADLAQTYDVTTETVRRDLAALDRTGILRRVHGGAVPVRALHVVEPGVMERETTRADHKDAIARAALEELRKILTDAGVEISYDKPSHAQSAAASEFLRMEADWEAGYLLNVRAAWQADNKIPNSKEASMAKAKAARVASDITLKAVEMAGTTGYSEETLLEKWGRDSKILDIFEGTQQIQQLVVASRLLGLSSSELK